MLGCIGRYEWEKGGLKWWCALFTYWIRYRRFKTRCPIKKKKWKNKSLIWKLRVKSTLHNLCDLGSVSWRHRLVAGCPVSLRCNLLFRLVRIYIRPLILHCLCLLQLQILMLVDKSTSSGQNATVYRGRGRFIFWRFWVHCYGFVLAKRGLASFLTMSFNWKGSGSVLCFVSWW